MLNLEELQKRFLSESYAKANSTTLPIKSQNIEKHKRLAIYQNNLFTALTNNLKQTYPTVCRFVDERFFNYACDNYIQHHPASSGNLDEYGKEFSEFLRLFEPTKELAYLADLADLEWLLHQSYLASTTPKSHNKYNLQFSPSSFILESSFPLDQLWEMGNNEEFDETSIDWDVSTICLLIYRTQQLSVRLRRTNQHEQALFLHIKKGTFSEIMAQKYKILISDLVKEQILYYAQ